MIPIPSPRTKQTHAQYLVIDGRLTNAGKSFLKLMSVYSKAGKNSMVDKINKNVIGRNIL